MTRESYISYIYINRKDSSYEMSRNRWTRHADSKWPKSWAEYGVIRAGLRQSDTQAPELVLVLSKELTE